MRALLNRHRDVTFYVVGVLAGMFVGFCSAFIFF